MPKLNYYAVAVGRNPGIYKSWSECRQEIFKFKGAKYKKFTNLDEAMDYIKTTNNTSLSSSKTQYHTQVFKTENVEKYLDKTYDNITIVFTDGSCINNGKSGSKILGGYGVFFGYEDPRNLAEPYLDNPTNNKTELYAIIRAIEIMIPKLNSDKSHSLYIFTDSIYSLKSFTEWAVNWEKRGWKKSDNGPIKNLNLIKTGYNLFKKYNTQIKICKVKAHTGKTDTISLYNDMADSLANQGAEKMANL